MAGFNSKRRLSTPQGFTLVELLIVVIILAILAGIVLPQFTDSSADAKLSATDTTLGNMRAMMDLYFQQHGEYPSANGDGVNAADTGAAFLTQLTQYTNSAGRVSTSKDPNHRFGPYQRKAAIPTEPMTSSSAIKIETAGTLGLAAEGTDPGGWRFDNVTGQFIVNHATWDSR